MNQRPPKSIDGMLPANRPRRHSVYIDRHAVVPTKLVSLQPRQGAIDMVKPVSRPGKRPAGNKISPPRPRGDQFRDQEVVVRLSKSHSLRARLTSVIQYAIIIAIALAAAYSTSIGQWFVLAYALYVLVFRRGSTTSFAMALLILVSVPVFQLLRQDGVANNMAVYVYELLVVGTVQAVIELRWPVGK